MANSGLYGPYGLTEQEIDYSVTSASPGAYVLGHQGDDGKFYIKYVGRSDNDVNNRLHDWIGKYSQFKFGYLEFPEIAFVKECNLYHDFGGPEKGLDNEMHPQRPANSISQCPRCNMFGGQGTNW